MIWMGARQAWPPWMAPVRAEDNAGNAYMRSVLIINNSVSSSANGEECEKSEIKEISGEGDISIKSELECVSNVGNAENNVGNADMRFAPENNVGNAYMRSVQENEVKEKLIKFDRESYRKDVLGMGPARQNFMIKKFGLLEFMK